MCRGPLSEFSREGDRAVCGRVGSSCGAVPALRSVRFRSPPSEPDVPVPEHPALHDLSRSTGGLLPAHRCSLVCVRSTVASAAAGVGHCAPMFIGDLLPLQHVYCGAAVCLRHAGGSPALGLLRRLRHAPRHQLATSLPAPGVACRGAGSAGRFPSSPWAD